MSSDVSSTNSAHYIQCTLQPCTAICNQPSVHTAANCSHLQPFTLQLYYPVHTAATPYSAHCIQCTSGPPKANSPICDISSFTYWWSVTAVQMMKKTGCFVAVQMMKKTGCFVAVQMMKKTG